MFRLKPQKNRRICLGSKRESKSKFTPTSKEKNTYIIFIGVLQLD